MMPDFTAEKSMDWSQTAMVQIASSPFSSCVTLRMLLNLSVLQLQNLWNRASDGIYITGLSWWLNKETMSEHSKCYRSGFLTLNIHFNFPYFSSLWRFS